MNFLVPETATPLTASRHSEQFVYVVTESRWLLGLLAISSIIPTAEFHCRKAGSGINFIFGVNSSAQNYTILYLRDLSMMVGKSFV